MGAGSYLAWKFLIAGVLGCIREQLCVFSAATILATSGSHRLPVARAAAASPPFAVSAEGFNPLLGFGLALLRQFTNMGYWATRGEGMRPTSEGVGSMSPIGGFYERVSR